MRRLQSAIIGLIGILIVPSVLLAQASGVTGVVNDESGAPIPGASVSLVRQGHVDMRTTISNRDGTFTFEEVSPASYVLKVQLNGFQDYQRVVAVGGQVTMPLKITLRVGGMEQEITVEGDTTGEPVGSPATIKVDAELLRGVPLDSDDVMSVIGRFI